jgi:hypothetical protein
MIDKLAQGAIALVAGIVLAAWICIAAWIVRQVLQGLGRVWRRMV